MVLDNGYAIIWLDEFIGAKDNNRSMKTEFQVNLVETVAVPPLPLDPIDDLICAVREYSAPIDFAQTENEALKLIEYHLNLEKKIIFISSASLGREILPKIQERKYPIETCYIFCGHIEKYIEWSLKCIKDGLEMHMFNHPTDLLIRLGRDMSNILTEDGKKLLQENKHELALKYFRFAYSLADKAFEHDKPLDATHASSINQISTNIG
ncbi:hypothetical protein I4U23_004913 [Adineta vaga]|nr:hypothetical protein I4U23_004913 [Adineta vaga]